MASKSRLEALISATHQHGVALVESLKRHPTKAGFRLLAYLKGLNARRRMQLEALNAKPPTHHPQTRHRFGVDYTNMDPHDVHRLGATFACRYLATPGNSKNLTPSESRALKRLGIDRVVVWETTAQRATAGHAAGRADARAALHMATQCGMPHNRPIYFAVDFDSDGGQVYDYFDGVKSVLGLRRTGCYGGVRVIRALFSTSRIAYGWQTYAWSAGEWDKRAQLQQYDNSNNAYDKDRSASADFGQW